MLTSIAGIHPLGVGFHSVRVSPNLGDLASLEAGMESPEGLIQVTYRRAGGRLLAEVTLPGHMTGEFVSGQFRRPLHPGHQQFGVTTTQQDRAALASSK
jgi:hypothetical protein